MCEFIRFVLLVMIIYDNDQWLNAVFKYVGTVWPNVSLPFVWWTIFVLACYFSLEEFQLTLGSDCSKSIFSVSMSFLLVFRANQAYARYWEGRTLVSDFFSSMRNFVMMTMLVTRGGEKTHLVFSGSGRNTLMAKEDEDDVKAGNLRIDVVRLSLAFATMLKMYTRIGLDGYCFGVISQETKWSVDWDRFRLRQLLHEYEFLTSDACLNIHATKHATTLKELADQFRERHNRGPPRDWPKFFDVEVVPAVRVQVPISFFIREVLIRSMNDNQNSVPWGIKEREVVSLINMLNKAESAFEMMSQIITTPLPLPYACLCKSLLVVWMMSFPFMLDRSLGFFGGLLIPILIALALLGIDAISTELENPFGDDANDLDILECIQRLEHECMEFLALSGDIKGRHRFVWRRVPGFIADQTSKPLMQYLTVASLAADEVVPSGTVTPASSYRSSQQSHSSLGFSPSDLSDE